MLFVVVHHFVLLLLVVIAVFKPGSLVTWINNLSLLLKSLVLRQVRKHLIFGEKIKDPPKENVNLKAELLSWRRKKLPWLFI